MTYIIHIYLLYYETLKLSYVYYYYRSKKAYVVDKTCNNNDNKRLYYTHLKFYPRHPFGKPNQTPKKHINIIAANRISNAKHEFEMVKRLKGEGGKYDF